MQICSSAFTVKIFKQKQTGYNEQMDWYNILNERLKTKNCYGSYITNHL